MKPTCGDVVRTPPLDGCCRWNRYMFICAVYNLPFPKRFENNFCGFVFGCCYYCAKCDYVSRRMRLSRVSLHQAMRLLDFFPSASVSVGVCTRFVYSFSSINSCFCPFYGTIAEYVFSARYLIYTERFISCLRTLKKHGIYVLRLDDRISLEKVFQGFYFDIYSVIPLSSVMSWSEDKIISISVKKSKLEIYTVFDGFYSFFNKMMW